MSYPFNPVVVIPWIKYFCKEKKSTKQGTRDNTDMANMGPQEEIPEASRKSRSPIGTVYF
jgi:hypothetical protein